MKIRCENALRINPSKIDLHALRDWLDELAALGVGYSRMEVIANRQDHGWRLVAAWDEERPLMPTDIDPAEELADTAPVDETRSIGEPISARCGRCNHWVMDHTENDGCVVHGCHCPLAPAAAATADKTDGTVHSRTQIESEYRREVTSGKWADRLCKTCEHRGFKHDGAQTGTSCRENVGPSEMAAPTVYCSCTHYVVPTEA